MLRVTTILRNTVTLTAVMVSTAACQEIDFTRDIRPILSGKCYACHGPDPETREAGLRLDQEDASRQTLDSGETAIVPNDWSKSELVVRVTTSDEFSRMPPPEHGAALSEKEVDLLKRWIEQGAAYARHWSFDPPQRPKLPDVGQSNWPRNPIDTFVLARLNREGLSPSPMADRTTLIRRVSLDLTGLPPSPDEVEGFINDNSPDAYERLVDRLLSSPRFGERWGRTWLDLARYADSAGYADDPPREIWKDRDWVINAINDGMPFDQFTIEQIAGDLLPDPTDDQLIATAFHRNTMTNSEGGTDDEEFRSAAIVDRVNTTLQTWMGLTMGCAQCHTHKYDPITQTEYYQVYAIFNQTEDADRRDEAPVLETWTPELLARKQRISDRIRSLQKQLDESSSPNNSEQAAAKVPAGPVVARYVRIELPEKDQFLSLAEVEVFSGDENLALNKPATQSSTAYDAPPELAVDGNSSGAFFAEKSTTHTEKENSPWWMVDLKRDSEIDLIKVWNRNDSPTIFQRLNGFRVVLLDQEKQPVWAKTISKAAEFDTTIQIPKTGTPFSEDEVHDLTALQQQSSPRIKALQKEIDQLRKQQAKISPIKTPVMRELPAEKQRTTHIQIRGNFLDLGDEVQAGVLNEFHPIDVETPNRLDFARWLMSPENPLTSRVLANRHWEVLFGRGLVETSEDFGMQGELPSHPELLDLLATRFVESDWSQKDLIRLIVTSATYRQSSDTTPDLIERDPANRLLTRGPRFRLSAELIRDQALSLSGLLSDKMLGPSVNPPRPKLGLRAAFGGSTDWETSTGEDKFRRGIYTTWRRSIPYPSMDAFDAPSREVCTVRRIRTNTPLQALVTLNDPVYVEAAQALAGRILTEGGDKLEDRLAYGFRLCTARSPNPSELEVLTRTFRLVQSQFESKEQEAAKLRVIPATAESEASFAEQASWTTLANVLLNLDETLTRR
ncbi:Planctomycete cytochrome C [Thalassoglobus neptunius]|uniref:Planctomycete cytochrome C n=1 Tax=Thalassoglobus neptunius TaxID=1938619 RepID=A0A5C5WP98_9PLAN|nr:DUF1553 domain-containing protein [Thalassoglobus neptunius]TWT51979.1 Planctomycete cytochrome C [Thalassoglobus neptunius]